MGLLATGGGAAGGGGGDETPRWEDADGAAAYSVHRFPFPSSVRPDGAADEVADGPMAGASAGRARRPSVRFPEEVLTVGKVRGDRGGSGLAPGPASSVELGVTLEVRSIHHAACPLGTGRRVGSGVLPGGFGGAARAISAGKRKKRGDTR